MQTEEIEEKMDIKNNENIEDNKVEETITKVQSIKEEDNENKKTSNWIIKVFICILTLVVAFTMYLYLKPHENIATIQENLKPDEVILSKINISLDNNEISIGEVATILTSTEPTEYVLENAIWESSNPEVITVVNGTITGVTLGSAKITLKNNEIISNELEVTCIQKVEEIKLSKTEVSIQIGDSASIKAEVLPKDATNPEISWSSKNEKIAKVDNGKITAIAEGTVVIVATDISGKVFAECTIRVEPIEVKKISLDETNVKLGIGQSYILMATVSPSNATHKELKWYSSDENIVTVNNGNIKAIGVGSATVTVESTNGKTANCTFTVQDSNPTNPIKYAKNTFNVRSGPGTGYAIISAVSKNDDIEILNSGSEWTKIRFNGVVGYIISTAYSSSKYYYIDDVPYLNQFSLGYPTGCEAVSATMVARYKGYNISSATVIANTPTDEKGIRTELVDKTTEIETVNPETGLPETTIEVTKEEVIIGGNPFEVFVGHPTKGLSAGSYGCFAKPIATALQNLGVSCTNISGCSSSTLFSYIEKGEPVIVWCVKNAGNLIEEENWTYPDNSGTFTKLKGEHCAVLIGYDGEYVYLNDPSAGKDVKQPKAKFLSNWNQLYCQAIIVN